MSISYLPLTDAALNQWSLNFVTQVTVDPAALGLTIEELAAYAALQSDFAAKYAAAINPETRGGATVLAKKNAKKVLVAESRKLAMAVTNHPSVTDQQRYDLGLTVRDNEPTPSPVPSAAPNIDIVSVNGHVIKLRLHDGQSTRRRKPAYVMGATVFSHIGEQPPVELADWKFEGNTTRTSETVIMAPTVAPGTKVWLTAFWYNRRAESGPATTPLSTYVGFGGVSKAA